MAERRFKAHPNLGTLIHNSRRAHKITLGELATTIGTTKSYLCEIERGTSPAPGFVMVCRISDALRIPMKHLKDAALTPERNMEVDRHEDDTDSWW
jgi:transcriptional regulator with XRE-family HTH domain